MPWYGWLFMALALGSIVGSLLLLRDNAGSNRESPRGAAQTRRRRKRRTLNSAYASPCCG